MRRTLAAAALVGLALGCWVLAEGRSAAAGDAAWGNIKGQVVTANNQVPERKKLDVNKDQNACLAKGPLLSDEWVVDPKTHGVRWVFVWLVPEKGGPPLAVHPSLKEIKDKDVVIDQPCCKFEPHALGMRQGQELIAKNSAAIAHNVHWTGFPIKNPGGNQIVTPGQSITVKDLKADKYPVEIKCDIHGWMKAYVRVFDNPYFSVTDEQGRFEIKDAPAGQYRLMVWHDSGYGPGGRDGAPITIKGGTDNDVGQLKMEVK